MKRLNLAAGILVLGSTLILSGCVARTYSLTRGRVDQDTTTGNKGYLTGSAPADSGLADRKTTRTTRVVEIELGFPKKVKTTYAVNRPTTALDTESADSPAILDENTNSGFGSEKYTVSKNDTLQKISKKFYGTTKKWASIYNANKDTLKGPDKVYPGQVLNIPNAQGPKALSQEPGEAKENLK